MRLAQRIITMMSGGAAAIPWHLAGGITADQIYGAWQAKGAASLAASYVNLANPGTNDLTEVVAPNFDTALGWGFTGTEHLLTGLTPDAAGRYSMFVKVSTVAQDTTDRGIVGYYSNSTRAFCIYKSATTNKASYRSGASGTFIQSAAAVSAGVFGLYGQYAWQDGAQIGDTGQPNQGTLAQQIRLGAVGTDADPGGLGFAKCNMQAAILFVKDVTLTEAQLVALSAAMANF